jgi:hypothetical protein
VGRDLIGPLNAHPSKPNPKGTRPLMYGSISSVGGELAATGMSTFAQVIGACTLVAAGLSVWKLARFRRRNDS